MGKPFVAGAKFLGKVRTQIETLRTEPEIAKGVPFGAEAVAKLLGEVEKLDQAQERIKRVFIPRLKRATLVLAQASDELRSMFNSNVLAFMSKVGKYAPELKLVGGTPLSRTHRPPKRKSAGKAEAA